jgi:hypothetical protein
MKELGRLHMKYVKSKKSKQEKLLKALKQDTEAIQNIILRYLRFCHDQYITTQLCWRKKLNESELN